MVVIDVSTRQVRIAGVSATPHGAWVEQIARHLADPIDGFLRSKRFLIHERDPLFTEKFRRVLQARGIDAVGLPPKSPNLKAYAERFILSIKSECLDRVILFGETHLRYVLSEYLGHYHRERNHQGLENRLILGERKSAAAMGRVVRRPRLGGLLNYYRREAA